MSKHEDSLSYLASWSAELTARADRVRHLIGDRHWLTDGHHKEVIVREFLSRYLPSQLVIGSGFIRTLDSDNCSPEIDILISDNLSHPAFFNEGGIQILPPSSAVAYIEMKSTFTSESFAKAIKAISNTQACLNAEMEPWRSACFVSVERTHKSFIDTVCTEVKKLITELNCSNASEIMHILPICISTFDTYIVFLKINSKNDAIVLNSFDFEKLSAPIAFSDLFEHIRNYFEHRSVGELSDLIMKLPHKEYLKREININE